MKTNFIKLLCLALAGTFLQIGVATAQDVQKRSIKFGHLNNTDHPMSMGARKFAELVKQKSDGKITVREFPASQLGNELQQQSALQGGIQEMTAPAPTSLAGIVKEFGLLDFPFIVSNFKQADELLDGPLGKALLNKLPEHGLVGLGFWDLGFRNITNSKHPITKGEDLQGLKIRVIPNPVFLETFKTFGANPVPMAFAELYSALEQKAVDGQENPLSVILSNKFYEVQSYVSLTNHVYASNILLVSKKFWDKLSADEKKIMEESANEAIVWQRGVSRDIASKALGELESHGMKSNTIAEAELAKMKSALEPIYGKFSAGYDPEIMKLFNSELKRVSQLKD